MPNEGRGSTEAKKLGAFYTPEAVADALATWVVRSGHERLLEPSVGDGALMAAAVARARLICGEEAKLKLLVCDIDPIALAEVSPKLPTGSEMKEIDFLQLDVGKIGKFNGVLANPPFTRNHAIDPKDRKALRERFNVFGAAGLWVHFLLHATEFLLPGGRLAAVIPRAALFTDYGRRALERLSDKFSAVELNYMTDRPLWTNGACERGAMLLAHGYGEGCSSLPIPRPWSINSRRAAIGDRAENAFRTLSAASSPLGSTASLRIGVVTGCNAVFLMSEDQRRASGICREDVVQVVSRTRQLQGLRVVSTDLTNHGRKGERTWLLVPQSLGDRGSAVRCRLAKIPPSRRSSTLWFRKRSPWWQVDLGAPCNAFFTYMNDFGPRLVLSAEEIRCTNALHHVYFTDNVPYERRMAAALTILSTFGQLAGERIGRTYGGGILKFELGEARRLPVLGKGPEPLHDFFGEADNALRGNDRDGARKIADQAVLAPILGASWRSDVSAMEEELGRRREDRRGL